MTLSISSAHARALAALRSQWPDVRIVVIGAAALGHHIPLSRTTADVDLAVVVGPEDIESLMAPLGWTRDATMEIRWHGPDGFRTDILPATPELLARGVSTMDGGDRAMSNIGFDLAIEHAIEIELRGTGETIHVASLPAIAMLKMVAWLDRPAERTKDLGDLALMLDLALPDDDIRRWDAEHPVGASGVAHDLQSAYFVGLSLGGVARERHIQQVEHFLSRLLAEDGRCSATMARAAGFGWDGDDRVRAMLKTFGDGIAAARVAA